MPDALDLYELCVQTPRTIVAFLRAAHGGHPMVLREDFSGTAAVSRRWVGEGLRRGELWRAEAVDLDGPTLDKARVLAGGEGVADGIEFTRADAVRAEPDAFAEADVVYVGNFSLGEIHGEDDLAGYLARCRTRLSRGNRGLGGGVLVFDAYGGSGAYKPLENRRTHRTRGHEQVEYVWRHEAGDQASGMVTNSISFRVVGADGAVTDLPRAFVYRWRLRPMGVLRAALLAAGFSSADLYAHEGLAPGQEPTRLPDPAAGEDWLGYVVARG